MAPFKNNEKLSELVKLYPCLYNKQESDFKKEDMKQRAWNEISKELNLSSGKEAEQLWNNLKKLLSKRRTKLKEVDVSGASAAPVNKARKSLEELNYLSWLFPYVKVRATKSNLSEFKNVDEEDYNDEEEQNVIDPQNEKEVEELQSADTSEEVCNNVIEGTSNCRDEINENDDTQILKRKSTGRTEKAKSKVIKREKSKVEEEELKAFQAISKLASIKENKGECEIFGELIATELKSLSQKEFLVAKHEIQNVLFKVRMEALETDSNDRVTKGKKATTSLQHPSTSTPVAFSTGQQYQPTAQSQIQPFQPYNSNNFDINSLGSLMKQVQDAASYHD